MYRHSFSGLSYFHVCLTSAGAVKLASLLPRFDNISDLNLSFVDAKVDALITSITHKSLKRLRLSGMILTPAAAAALGRSLPEMSSLEILDLAAACNQRSLEAVDVEALFGRFNKTLPLYDFSLSGVSGYLAPLTKSLRFFPNLQQLYLKKLDMNEQNVCDSLFGRFNKTVPLQRLSFGGFSGKGCHSSLTNSVHFFPG